MTRRTALQTVAAIFAAVGGKHIMDDQTTGTGTRTLAEAFRPTSLRLHLESDVKLEVSFGDDVIEIQKDELIAALRPKR